MDQKRKKLMDEASMEALRIIESAKEESQKVRKEMRAIRDSAAFRDAQAKAEEARAKLKAQSDKIGKAGGRQPVRRGSRPKNLKLGDEVLIASMDQRATVLTLPDKNGNLQVQAGIMKIKVKLSDLIGVQQEPASVKPTVRTTTGAVSYTPLDVYKRQDPGAAVSAERQGVDIRLYRVIYTAIEEIEAAMKGMLEPTYKEVVTGHAELRQTFKVSGLSLIHI